MSEEGIRVLVARLRELERIESRQKQRTEEIPPVSELLDLQKRGFEYIEATAPENRFSKDFRDEVAKLAKEERRLRTKIETFRKRDRMKDFDNLLATQKLISDVRSDLWLIGFREDLRSGRFSK